MELLSGGEMMKSMPPERKGRDMSNERSENRDSRDGYKQEHYSMPDSPKIINKRDTRDKEPRSQIANSNNGPTNYRD